MAHTVLAYLIRLVCMMCMNAKAMPTNDIDYSCHLKAVELVYRIILGEYHTTS